ncbi:GNAT family N-acetyltransferase [Paenibacillus gorillae]|uniref:GNAT family N-acetyltransferase n=1 Tax=Paenibacillus gorillae TaxID=1243662 RepID=UPI0004BC7089|nr:GNAT family N-acetyltransferase [Paenibacillus gorillae]
MYLEANRPEIHNDLESIRLRKATNADAWEIHKQNAIYFGDKLAEVETSDLVEGMIQPEEEEKRGLTIYLAEEDEQVIGKVHLQLSPGIGGIYGLGVLPEYRGKGYGRAILLRAIDKLKEANAGDIMLQVAVENGNALRLYQSCGFVETSTMDYYELQ